MNDFDSSEGARPTVLVMAGRRGPADPMAEHAGCSHKAMVPVAGRAMLARVVETLAACPSVGDIVVCIDEEAILRRAPELDRALDQGRIRTVGVAESPARSVLRYLDEEHPGGPLLVTTADHALLEPRTVEYFLAEATAAGVDVAVGVMSETTFRASYPRQRRTVIRLRDEGWGGTNLFWLATAEARSAVAFWRRAESYRKQPWRLAAAIGPATLAAFALRRLDLAQACARLGAVMGVRVAAVSIPYAVAAIDVDTIEDLEVAEGILAEREAAGGATTS